MPKQSSYNAEQLEERMDIYLDAALSSRRTAAAPAATLAAFGRREQEFVLHWGRVVARDNPELAYQFTAFAPEAMRHMTLDAVKAWLLYVRHGPLRHARPDSGNQGPAGRK